MTARLPPCLVTDVDECQCGAMRRTETNGWHVTRGSWELPETGEAQS